MNFNNIIIPNTLDEAYSSYIKNKKSVLLAGGAFLKLQNRDVHTVIDLRGLNIDRFNYTDDSISIGSMVTLRSIEKNDSLPTALVESVKQVGSISVRNLATIGGSISGKYPFSDTITTLLSLNAELIFYKTGKMFLEDFLAMETFEKDILLEIIIPKVKHSLYKSHRLTYTDFAVINLSLSYNGLFRLSIGARPMIAQVVENTNLDKLVESFEDITYADDLKASAKYRKALAKAMLEDAIKEAKLWK